MKFLFTGDISLIGSAETTVSSNYRLRVTSQIKKLFDQESYKVINLENPLTISDNPIKKSGPKLKSNPESIKLLKDLKVDVACLANNHIRDYGDRGVIDTILLCKENDIMTVGAGKNLNEASKPLVFKDNGEVISILNFSEQEYNIASENRAGGNPDSEIHIWKSVIDTRKKTDILIVVMHGGREMYNLPTPEQLKLYRFIIDLGADIVVGHHSHVLGGFEFYKNKPIIYSLGNFIFDEKGNDESWYIGAIAEVEFHNAEIIKINIYKSSFIGGTLKILDGQNLMELTHNGFFHYVKEEDVNNRWNELIRNNAYNSCKSLLDIGIIRRILWKLGFIFISKNESKRLGIIGNRFRCRSHREFYSNVIEAINKQ